MEDHIGTALKARDEQILTLSAQGLSSRAIAHRLSLSLAVVKHCRAGALLKLGAPLTGREQEVAELAAQGLTSAEISQKIGLSERTIEVHRYRLMKKLGARNAVELALQYHKMETEALHAQIAELQANVARLEAEAAVLRGKSECAAASPTN
ncbi:helix-turn-helix domain-containing protein [Devosia submarina]|uniref:helix-turn-helix domain-containing protein n=1 Tax=Devosia submarina TaxID=1173082 RepID=UPI00130088CF|nr:helix-turn-helix transcriptional regulator [Devosia submarina]